MTVSCELDCSAKEAARQMVRPELLDHVAWPVMRFVPDRPHPSSWTPGEYPVRCVAFRVVPLGRQVIVIEVPESDQPGVHILRDNGRGLSGILRGVSRWDHSLTVRPHESDPHRARYSDDVVIEAGRLTPVVWLFASGFYRWRQYRWRRLARVAFAPLTRADGRIDEIDRPA